MWLTETTLEMHYHRPLLELFRDTFGLGKAGHFNYYKYSTQRETFVGFDQAYVRSELTEAAFFDQLKQAASGGTRLPDRFLGYFLQFKVVSEVQRRSRYTPPGISALPHWRSELDTARSARTGTSQHELLFNLAKQTGAFVYYACPMLFDRSALYDINVDLDTLALADVKTCPSDYCDNDPHYVYFDTPIADPVWRSEPVTGRAIRPLQLFEQLAQFADGRSADALAQHLMALLTAVTVRTPTQSDEPPSEAESRRALLREVGGAFTVIRIRVSAPAKA